MHAPHSGFLARPLGFIDISNLFVFYCNPFKSGLSSRPCPHTHTHTPRLGPESNEYLFFFVWPGQLCSRLVHKKLEIFLDKDSLFGSGLFSLFLHCLFLLFEAPTCYWHTVQSILQSAICPLLQPPLVQLSAVCGIGAANKGSLSHSCPSLTRSGLCAWLP